MRPGAAGATVLPVHNFRVSSPVQALSRPRDRAGLPRLRQIRTRAHSGLFLITSINCLTIFYIETARSFHWYEVLLLYGVA